MAAPSDSLPPMMNADILFAGSDFEPSTDPMQGGRPGDDVTPEHAANGAKDRDPATSETPKKAAPKKAKKDKTPEPEPDDEVEDDEVEDDEVEGDEVEDDEVEDDEVEDGEVEDDEEDPAPKKKAKVKAQVKADPDPAENKQGQVPKWRLDQQTKARREAERELQTLRDQVAKTKGEQPADDDTPAPAPKAQQTSQLKTLREKLNGIRDKYEEALIDGDTEKARTLRGELDDVADEMLEVRISSRADQVTKSATSQSKIEAELTAEAAVVAGRFDAFNSEHDAYDSEAIDELVAMRDMYYQKGRAPRDALREAAETVAAKYGFVDNEAAKDTAKKADKKPTEDADNLESKQRAAKAQPKKMSGQRNQKKALDIPSMTDAEFDAFMSDEENMKAARGDFRVE